MQRGVVTFVRLLLTVVAALWLPAGMYAQEPGGQGQGRPEALPQELAFDSQFTLRYPANWSELPSVYRNSKTLVSVPKNEHAKLSATKNAHGLGERVARVVITIEQRRSHDEAVQRLREIASSFGTPATFLEIGGWPALEQSRMEQRPLKGASPVLQQPASQVIQSDDRFTLHKTTAIAAGTLLIRLEAAMPPKGNEQLQRDVEAIGRSVRASGGAGPAAAPAAGATAAAVSSLRAAEEKRSTGSVADNVVVIPTSPAGVSADPTSPGYRDRDSRRARCPADRRSRSPRRVTGVSSSWARTAAGPTRRTRAAPGPRRPASTALPRSGTATAIHPSPSAGAATSTPPSSDGRPASTARIRPARPRTWSSVRPTTARASRSSTTPSSATTPALARASPTRSTSPPIA